MIDSSGDKKFKIGKRFVISHLYEVKAGDEEAVVSSLQASGFKNCFKAFGKYDMVIFEEGSGPDLRLPNSSCQGVTGTTALSLYSLEVTDYVSPCISEWVDDAPIIGYVALELDKAFYRHPLVGGHAYVTCERVISVLRGKCSEQGLEVAFYGGLGRPELVAIVKSKDLAGVWAFSSMARTLTSPSVGGWEDEDQGGKFSVFSKTTTIPAISYQNIHFGEDSVTINNIEGECETSITIDCPPGFESRIAEYFPAADGYQTRGLLGANDVLVQTTKPVPTGQFVSTLFNFRRQWASSLHAPLASVTSVLSVQNNLDSQTEGYDIEISLEELAPLTLVRSKAPRLANRLLAFIHKYNSIQNNRAHHLLTRNLRHYLIYLCEILYSYEAQFAPDHAGEVYIDESMIMEALELIELGLAQRLHDGFDSPESPYSVLLPPGEGFFSSLIGIEHLVAFIMDTWGDTNPKYPRMKSWVGFPIFSDTNGFALSRGETIFVPYDAINDGTSPKGSWLTLTHEISHAIYLRLDVPNELAPEFERLHRDSFPLQIKSREAGIYTPVDDQLNEFFTHWYDYYHFFNRDYERFLASVWRSWLCLSIVNTNFEEYILRSYMVFMLTQSDRLVEEYKRREGLIAVFLGQQWDVHLQQLSAMQLGITPQQLSVAIAVKEQLLGLALRYVPVVVRFLKYKNEDFREAINKDYPELNKHVAMIESGEVVLSKIENPYFLTKEVIFKNSSYKNAFVTTALTISLKNQVALYHIGDGDE